MTPRQLELPATPPPKPRLHAFPGPDFERKDSERLSRQLDRVRELMSDGDWRTIKDIAVTCRCSENSASAQLRHLRKPPPLGINATIERKRDAKIAGLNWYRMEAP